MFYLVGIFRTSGPGGSISSDPERTVPRRWRGGGRLCRSCSKRQIVWTSEDYCWLRKTRYFKEFSTFLCMRRCKGLGLLKSFLLYASQLLIWKDPGAGKDWRQEEKGTTEDEMVGGHHQLSQYTQTHVYWVGNATNNLILCRPFLLLPSIFPSTRVFSNESALHIR